MNRTLLGTSLLLLGLLAACTTKTTVTSADKPAGENPESGEQTEVDPDDPANQPPHSLGVIMLGESHASGGSGRTSPIVSASFYPDAMLTRACKKKLDGCEIIERPKCTKVKDSSTGCGEDEACTFDTSCEAVCKKVAVCEESCEEDEVCRIPAGSKTSAGKCVKAETFDAGPIAFSGTTTAITLYPPYEYEGKSEGAPFLAGAELRVQAQGATDAGFEKFDETFTATTFLQTKPALSKIPREKVFGTGSLPVSWAPGEDQILITVSGIGGSATCKAKDAEGKFDIPRSVLDAVLTAPDFEGTATLSLTVARQKKDVKKDKVAKGELSTATVQPEGWLELVTTSMESASFQGCSSGAAICGDECVDLKNDPNNCGACGKSCGGSMACAAGKCVDPVAACNTCVDGTKTGSCKSSWGTCQADASCKSLWSCIEACTTQTCAQQCQQQYPDGASKAQSFASCAQNACAEACGE